MILSKRERYIVTITVAFFAMLAFYYVILDPLLSSRAGVIEQIDQRGRDLATARMVIAARDRNQALWDRRISPPMARNRPDAEGLVRRSVSTWASQSRLALPSFKSDGRDEKELLPYQKKPDYNNPNAESFHKVSFHGTATGSMRSITEFLFKIRTADFPLRITELNISTKKEGTDELTLTIGLTSIYYPPQAEQAPAATVAALSWEAR